MNLPEKEGMYDMLQMLGWNDEGQEDKTPKGLWQIGTGLGILGAAPKNHS